MGKLILRLGLTCALGAGCLWSAGSWAAADPAVRPRICLVLSGGGARGMAHIGVLKVLEDLKIPIDCIAGTSMGAIVGGLYASGMTAADIDATMRSLDWQEAFRDAPPRRDLAFRRKQDDRNFLVRLPLGLQHRKILLPKGFIQGQKLQETLRQLTLPFSSSTDFDLLPTPFRAVATDLETGNAVVMDHRRGIVTTVLKHACAIHHRFYAVKMRQPVEGRCGLGDIDSSKIRARGIGTSAHGNDDMAARRQVSDNRGSYQSRPSYHGNFHNHLGVRDQVCLRARQPRTNSSRKGRTSSKALANKNAATYVQGSGSRLRTRSKRAVSRASPKRGLPRPPGARKSSARSQRCAATAK